MRVWALNVIVYNGTDLTYDIYLYDHKNFIEKICGGKDIRDIPDAYEVADFLKWHFSKDSDFEELVKKIPGMWEYYQGSMTLVGLHPFLIYRLNFKHTGLGVNYFEKHQVYSEATGGTKYLCISAGDKIDALFLRMQDIEDYRADGKQYDIPKDTEVFTYRWLDINSQLIPEMREFVVGDFTVNDMIAIF